MPARHFTSASVESISLSLGAMAYAFGPASAACIFLNPASLAAATLIGAGSNTSIGWRFNLTGATGALRIFSNGSAIGAATGTSVSKWYFGGVSKATGTVAPRFHLYDYVTNTWVHENGGTVANSSSPGTRVCLGSAGDTTTTPFNGDIAAAGAWNVVLSDAQFESLAYDLNAWWAPAQPKGLWLLDQDAVAQKVIDQSGNGSNQSGITGTSLGTSSVPVFSRGAFMVAA
jgi:hypothetical protein